jgi:hypothetical protein
MFTIKIKKIKDIINLVFEKYKIKIHQKQIIDIIVIKLNFVSQNLILCVIGYEILKEFIPI